MRISAIALLAAAAFVGGCDGQVGEGKGSASGTTPEGRSEANKISISAPGVALKVDLPRTMIDDGDLDADGGPIYPGSTLTGMHIQANEAGGVELRFATADAVDAVAGWYRTGADREFTVASEAREGAAYRFAGTMKEDATDRFTVRLSPRAGGGTEGIVAITGS